MIMLNLNLAHHKRLENKIKSADETLVRISCFCRSVGIWGLGVVIILFKA